MKNRILTLAAVAAVAVGGPVAGVLTTHVAAQADRPGSVVSTATVRAPAAGSYLTVVDRGTQKRDYFKVTSQRLELVSPTGRTHTVTSHRVVGDAAPWTLADWSTDGRTALLSTGDAQGAEALLVDVASGAVHRIALGRKVGTFLLDPAGGGLLAVGYAGPTAGASPLFDIAPDGAATRLATRSSDPILAEPDGSVLASSETSGGQVMRVLDRHTGAVVDRYPTGGHCVPVRWWVPNTALVSCSGKGSGTQEGGLLSLLDLQTGALTALTGPHPRGDLDLGDADARRVPDGLFLQVEGGCGTVYLDRAGRGGALTRVQVPHAVGNVLLVDASGHDLVLQHAGDCDGHRPVDALTRFDPSTGHEKAILELPADERFETVRVLGEARASSL